MWHHLERKDLWVFFCSVTVPLSLDQFSRVIRKWYEPFTCTMNVNTAECFWNWNESLSLILSLGEFFVLAGGDRRLRMCSAINIDYFEWKIEWSSWRWNFQQNIYGVLTGFSVIFFRMSFDSLLEIFWSNQKSAWSIFSIWFPAISK